MLEYNADTDNAKMIVTLSENVTVFEPVYVFEFVHVLTKQVVTFNKTVNEDESDYSERYNMFTINPSVLFNAPGEWHYKVIEQQTNVVLEQGKMLIKRPFNFNAYNGTTSFRTYNG